MKYFILGFICSQLIETIIKPGFIRDVKYWFKPDRDKTVLPTDYYQNNINFFKKQEP